MRIMLRLPAILIALLFGVTGSQLPEYVQQYSQRLGGAVDELTAFVTQFDQDARDAGLTRKTALHEYDSKDSEFLGRRGKTVADTIRRYERLKMQKAQLDRSGPFGRVLRFLRAPQSDIAGRAWEDFKPAVPLTIEGGLFAFMGFVLSLLVSVGARRGTRAVRDRMRPVAETQLAETHMEDEETGSGSKA